MSDKKNSRWKILTEQLRNKYRLVILNDDSFAEKFSLKLSPLGIIILFSSVTIVMTTFVISIIAFTTLREYIPGYGNVNDRKDIIILSLKVDSLENTLSSREWYINNLLNVFSGKTEAKPQKPVKDATGKYAKIDVQASVQDLKLRNEIETNQLTSTSDKVSSNKLNSLSNYFFFCPIKGIITNSYNINEDHFGIDVAAKENELIKSTLDGTVISAEYTSNDGYTIQIQHGNDLISIYKHCSVLTKKTGDFIKAGEPIAIVGNTGELSSGPHLHFEIWYNGFSINPQNYVVF
jgi:murein DD-endopeptidase MepM/ murein hydrolase activator NlpD